MTFRPPKSSDKKAKEAMELAEASRETDWQHPSFLAELFMGRFQPNLIFPFPEQSSEDREVGDKFLEKVESFLKERVDPDEIDRTREIPDDVLRGLIELGCFRMKIPAEYGGLGFSQVNYNRAMAMISSYCGSTAVFLSAHQSIGAPQPLKMFGSEEQKKKYLPRLAEGAISAFALTEPGVGSDPAKMLTTATPSPDGKTYVINGLKQWCTNGPVSDIIIVMAKTPSKWVDGKEKKQISAFIVEKDMPGFEVRHRCDFMGLKGIQNGLLNFNNVVVPKENLLWEEGKGLKLALVTLNTGRLTLPAACSGMVKACLRMAREWSNEREQWGRAIGKHEAVASKIARMSSTLFAMESITWLTSGMADTGQHDIRLEAAMAKLFCTEAAWHFTDETVQIRGGRGYETADSLRARGEKAYPVERMLRDARINTIIEGTSEIMRLFIAREALDGHMRLAGDILKPKIPWGRKAVCAAKAGIYYAGWYPKQWLPLDVFPKFVHHGQFGKHMRFISQSSRKTARNIFHAMMRYQAGLEHKQILLARIVDIGADLFAMTASIANAERMLAANPDDRSPLALADAFCRQATRRVNHKFRALFNNDDASEYRLAREVLKGEMEWLEDGIVDVDYSTEHVETEESKPDEAVPPSRVAMPVG
ncbi:MAG: acyl-CoA dehydrogenase family protein [Planctomycetota bacterium]|nr:acyl-CoA dehydrogenase family protein [Planctomycetota bacterium]